ncbi:MAG: uracil-DNA glycosylase [Pseudomonadota bacterium]
MTEAPDRAALLATLAFQVSLGADEAIGETPIDRFATLNEARPSAPTLRTETADARTPAAAPRGRHRTAAEPPDARPSPPSAPDAADLATAATNLTDLADSMAVWTGSDLRLGARNLVFADGHPGARVMIIGEAPGAEEDRTGKPFVGRAGQLLDRMLASIGLSRRAEAPEHAAYITNILPWRPPGNRTPSEAEARAFLPFVERHIALAAPEVIFSLGNTPTKALMATGTGIKRMRGTWAVHAPSGLPVLPSFHPAYLLRQPADKALAWRDLLALRARLDGHGPAP